MKCEAVLYYFDKRTYIYSKIIYNFLKYFSRPLHTLARTLLMKTLQMSKIASY